MSHISYSEIKTWKECPYRHKLMYLDRIKGFKGNIFTAFGTALHNTCELIAKNEPLTIKEQEESFEEQFLFGITKLPPEELEAMAESQYDSFNEQGISLVKEIMPALKKQFGNYEFISAEERLMEDVELFDLKFKGYIDLVIRTEDGKYHIIDWKTCSWGWDSHKKNDKMVVYQLAFYKHYFAQKHNIDPKDIELYFGLLKRTAKKNRVEIFRVSGGKRRVNNALGLMTQALKNINKGVCIKNRLSCKYCAFYKTQHCT